MDTWHIIIQPALVTLGAAWGLWYLTKPKKDPLGGTLHERIMQGTTSKSYNPERRAETRYLKEWKGGCDNDKFPKINA